MGISALGKLIGRTLASQGFYAKWAKFNNITKLLRVCFYHFTSSFF